MALKLRKPIVLDLETKKTLREVEGDVAKLGVSCVGIYNYATESFRAFLSGAFSELFQLLENASFIVGFNIDRFDFPVLDTYYPGKLQSLPTIDLLERVKESYGKRLPLDELAQETLGVSKSGHGLLAIEYYREGKIEELKKYCLDDVKITRDLYEYGKREGEVFFRGPRGRSAVRVDWGSFYNKQTGKEVNLTLGI